MMKRILARKMKIASPLLEELGISENRIRETIAMLHKLAGKEKTKPSDNVMPSARASALSVVLREAAASLDPADFEVLLKTHFSKPKTEETQPKRPRKRLR